MKQVGYRNPKVIFDAFETALIEAGCRDNACLPIFPWIDFAVHFNNSTTRQLNKSLQDRFPEWRPGPCEVPLTLDHLNFAAWALEQAVDQIPIDSLPEYQALDERVTQSLIELARLTQQQK